MVGNNKQALRIHANRDEINTHNTKKQEAHVLNSGLRRKFLKFDKFNIRLSPTFDTFKFKRRLKTHLLK